MLAPPTICRSSTLRASMPHWGSCLATLRRQFCSLDCTRWRLRSPLCTPVTFIPSGATGDATLRHWWAVPYGRRLRGHPCVVAAALPLVSNIGTFRRRHDDGPHGADACARGRRRVCSPPGEARRHRCLHTGLVVCDGSIFYETRALATFTQFGQWVRANVFLVAICIPFLIASVARYPERSLPKVAVFAILVVLSGLGGLHLMTDRPYLDKLLEQPGPRVNLATNSPAIRDAPLDPNPTRVVGLGTLLFEGTQALYGLEGIGGPDPLEMGPYQELVDGTGIPRDSIWLTFVTPERLDRMGPLLDLLNVGLVITPQNQLAAGLVKVGDDADPWIDVTRRPSAWPRAFFVDGIRKYTTPADLLNKVREEGSPFAGIQADDLRSQRFTYQLPIGNARCRWRPTTSSKPTAPAFGFAPRRRAWPSSRRAISRTTFAQR